MSLIFMFYISPYYSEIYYSETLLFFEKSWSKESSQEWILLYISLTDKIHTKCWR